ncbi:hypothetical protein TNCV_996601 [Trichonephila clavipes]|nr:hypothetical protein TNCV_996601 [Trichonephila clavipes]
MINTIHGTSSYVKFPYAIRTAVNETTRKTPAELFLGRKLITPFQKLVMVSDGTEFAVGGIERLMKLDETQRPSTKNRRVPVGTTSDEEEQQKWSPDQPMRRGHNKEDQFESENAENISTAPTSESKQGQQVGRPEAEVVNHSIARRGKEERERERENRRSQCLEVLVDDISYKSKNQVVSFHYIFFRTNGRKNYCKEASC